MRTLTAVNGRDGLNCPPVESLETRLLFSASLRGASLVVAGTQGNDVITVGLNPSDAATIDVAVNGDVRSFDASRIRKPIRVNGLAGDDRITVAPEVTLPTILNGGAGNDIIVGGAGADQIIGGKGDDDLDGGPGGADRIAGGPGRNVFASTAVVSNAITDRRDDNDDDDVRITLKQAPPAVQATIANLLGSDPLRSLFRDVDDDGPNDTEYELKWDAGLGRQATILADGTVVEQETVIDPLELPVAVVNAIAAKYPQGRILKVETSEKSTRPLRYEVDVENGTRVRELDITPDGAIVDDDSENRRPR